MVLALSVFFLACGGKDAGGNDAAVTDVVLSAENLTISVNESVTLTASVFPEDAAVKEVTWKSSDETVASVQNGVVKGIGKGSATITATTKDGEKTASCKVLVEKTLHSFVVDDIYGKAFDLSQLKGKKVLIVNVASQCGLTPQYADLQKLYETHARYNFVIIGFPCNDFGGQEPGTSDEIVEFCQSNYGVTFPLMSKVSVKGNAKAPLYKWLTEKSENEWKDVEIEWNFQKFMIDENGQIVDCLSPQSPFFDRVATWVKGN
ncbi:MAG: Ig-like domain-containing protein [Bacteroidales bacterium]|nr:Ig-like domain-containing protein [Bacteroidales bacterium]